VRRNRDLQQGVCHSGIHHLCSATTSSKQASRRQPQRTCRLRVPVGESAATSAPHSHGLPPPPHTHLELLPLWLASHQLPQLTPVGAWDLLGDAPAHSITVTQEYVTGFTGQETF
jgi:hypothetical protein